MKQTELMFFFDTEDFTSNRSCDAIRDLATLFTEEGIVGHFAVVGLLGWQLVHWQRKDVLDALSRHEIESHTYGHSLHPNICEISDCADAYEAIRNVKQVETDAVRMLEAATGKKRIQAAIPPGNSKSYAAMYAYAEMGMEYYCDTVLEDGKGSDLYYCNICQIPYVIDWEPMLMGDPMNIDEVLDMLAARDRAIVYVHPNKAIYTKFWDSLNYHGENKHPFGQWEIPDERPAEQTERFYERIRQVLRRMKQDPRFKLTTLPEISASRRVRKPLTVGEIPAIRSQLEAQFAPIPSPALSISDVFFAARAFMMGETVYQPTTGYGFLEEPKGITAPVTVTRRDVTEAAAKIEHTFLPASIPVGEQEIGPADLLFAMLEFLTTGKDAVTLQPRAQKNDISMFPKLVDFRLPNSWTHSPELKDNYLSDRLRLQCWTLWYPEK